VPITPQQEPVQFLQLSQIDSEVDSLNQGLYLDQEKVLGQTKTSAPADDSLSKDAAVKIKANTPKQEEIVSSKTSLGEKPGKIGQKSASSNN
jgi:hypothetical protein